MVGGNGYIRRENIVIEIPTHPTDCAVCPCQGKDSYCLLYKRRRDSIPMAGEASLVALRLPICLKDFPEGMAFVDVGEMWGREG